MIVTPEQLGFDPTTRDPRKVADDVRDGKAVLEGIAEIAVHEARDPGRVLHVDRLVETVFRAQILDALVVDRLTLGAELCLHRGEIVARRKLDDGEDEDADHGQRADHRDEAVDEISEHRSIRR